MSTNFGNVDIEHLQFPVEMHIDWIRVYQPEGHKNIGCDPPAFPTQSYINTYVPAIFSERMRLTVFRSVTSKRIQTRT